MDNNQMFLLRLIAFGLLIFFLHKIFNPKPTPVHEESEKERKLRLKEIEKEESVDEFIETFGFDPEFIQEHKHRKELILKLGLLAREIKESAEDALRSPDIYRDDYAEVSKKYARHLELISVYDPELEKNIPHWTELPLFAQQWIDGERHKGKQQRNPVR